jgi:hypothetical protein
MYCPGCLDESDINEPGKYSCKECDSEFDIHEDATISLLKRTRPTRHTYIYLAFNVVSFLFPPLLFVMQEIKPDNFLFAWGLITFLLQGIMFLYDLQLDLEHEKYDRRSYQYMLFIKKQIGVLDKISRITFFSGAGLIALALLFMIIGAIAA